MKELSPEQRETAREFNRLVDAASVSCGPMHRPGRLIAGQPAKVREALARLRSDDPCVRDVRPPEWP